MHVRSVLLAAAVALAGLAVVPAAHADDTDLSAIPAPTVTWPDQTNIGGDNPPYVIHVEDTDDPAAAATTLVVGWEEDRYAVEPHGDAELPFDAEYSGPLHVYRCRQDVPDCVDTGVESPAVTIHQNPPIQITVADHALGVGEYDLPVTIRSSASGSYLLDWWVDESQTVGRTGMPVELGDLGDGSVGVALQLDLSDLADGPVHLHYRLRRVYDGYGQVTSNTPQSRVVLDHTAPGVPRLTMTNDVLYPENDGYHDSTRLRTQAMSRRDHVRIEILDPSGEVLRTSSSAYFETRMDWAARDADGDLVPSGRYGVRVSATDNAGNVTSRVWGISVRPGHVVNRHTTLKVPAASSMVDSWVGRCAAVHRPASRGWKDSLGYVSNASCESRTKQGLVLTVHRVRLPKAAKYRTIAIGAYGGAAPSAPRSRLRLELFSPDRDPQGRWLAGGLGQHWVRGYDARHFLYGDKGNLVYWRAYTGGGAAYDVRSFSIRLAYQVIEVG